MHRRRRRRRRSKVYPKEEEEEVCEALFCIEGILNVFHVADRVSLIGLVSVTTAHRNEGFLILRSGDCSYQITLSALHSDFLFFYFSFLFLLTVMQDNEHAGAVHGDFFISL